MNNDNKLRLDRREFMKVSSLGVASVAVFGEQLFAAGGDVSSLPPVLSVGYTAAILSRKAGQETIANSAAAADANAVGDPAFIQSGAIVRVREFYVAPQNRRRNMTLSLVADFAPGYDGSSAPFYAWSYIRQGNRVMESSPIRFTMPIDAIKGAKLTMTRSAAAIRGRSVSTTEAIASAQAGTAGSSVLQFTVGQEQDRVKLQRGTYFVAIRTATDQKQPDWTLVRTADSRRGEQASQAFLYSRGILDDSPVDFDYLVIEVEPGVATA